MASLTHSIVFAEGPKIPSFLGSSLKPSEQYLVNLNPINLTLSPIRQRRGKVSTYKCSPKIQAGYSGDGERPFSASIFVGGFVLGGLIVGALGCVYAPQISRTLAGADRKDLMRKLPKFIYDEDKALEKSRKILTEKIAQLNSAIDGVSTQLRDDDDSNVVALPSDEVEAAV